MISHCIYLQKSYNFTEKTVITNKWWRGHCTNCYQRQNEFHPGEGWGLSRKARDEKDLGSREMVRWCPGQTTHRHDVMEVHGMLQKDKHPGTTAVWCVEREWQVRWERLSGARSSDCPAQGHVRYSRQWDSTEQSLKQESDKIRVTF